MLSESGGQWAISGIIDFGDARIGHPYYDFIAPLAHYAYGESEVSKALLRGYGLEVTGPVMESLTKYCLLHEFGRLGDFLSRHFAADPEAFWKHCGARAVLRMGGSETGGPETKRMPQVCGRQGVVWFRHCSRSLQNTSSGLGESQ